MELNIEVTGVVYSPEYVAGLQEVLKKQELEEGGGFICLMLCDDINGFHVYYDDEVAWILNQKIHRHVHTLSPFRDTTEDFF